MNSIVVHYQEIALKGRNRPYFVARFVHNLRVATAGLGVREVRPLMGRVEVVLDEDRSFQPAAERIRRVFGGANFAKAGYAPHDVEAIASAILADLGDQQPSSFRVSAKRADKRFPMTSPEIEREVGGRIKLARGWRVDLDHPELTIHVELVSRHAFYFFGKERGPGGLPTGVSGRVTCLLSGGIDSPVAAWRMMKRGCQVDLVHFHSHPFVTRASQEKVREIADLLTGWQLKSRLFLVPFGQLQREIVLAVPSSLRVVLYRRMMVRIADRIARSRGAGALVTGEVIGQVASQTLENMSVIAGATPLPILRPLVGMDKEEIVAEAERIGTYAISIVPDQDCCQLFTPRHPATKARLAEVEAAERLLPVEAMVARAVEAAEVEQYRFPAPSSIGPAATPGGIAGTIRSVHRGSPRSSTSQGASMTYTSVQHMVEALAPAATVTADTVKVPGPLDLQGRLVDDLAETAAFGADAEIRGTARWIIRSLAAESGIRPASIHDLYMAMGRGEVAGFTVPAINIRAMAYLSSRAAFRAARAHRAGAVIFEIARSEIGYTEQRPHEYAAIILAAALREKFGGPVFLQGDHVQVNAKKYAGPDREKELAALKALIREEIRAGFFNIDIDTSTLVDLSKPTLEEQQRVNFELAADFARFIRAEQPKGVTISIGGEIGEVGGKNSDVHELRAYMDGFNATIGPGLVGLSKISVQTGTAHGGFVGPDGKVRTDVKIDLETLRELSALSRREYGMGGAVQHGASTLPPDAFDAFPRVGACEIHLATDFQNMVYEHPSFPAALKQEIYAWLKAHALEERKEKDTEEQFLYKARKKAIGPFKRQMWGLSPEIKEAIGASLEGRFAFLLAKLNVGGTAEIVGRHVKAPALPISRSEEVAAASGVITASERKAEGLAD